MPWGCRMMQLVQVSQVVDGQLIGADTDLCGVTTDTRNSCHNELFIALKGERFDAHDYVESAKQAGASAILVEKNVACDLPKILVKDSHIALQKIAAWWRFQHVIPVVGVTGSVGKTSVKEMLACIFNELGKGLVTKGNFNNEIGVPLTLLNLKASDRYAIVEMGMNHAGEISRLTNITKPTIALINNAGAAHLEGLGTVKAVARAKGEIFEGLNDDGVAIINEDDEYASLWHALVGKKKIITFGVKSNADVTADYDLNVNGIKMRIKTHDNEFSLELSALGQHNVSNALAAVAVATAANIPVNKIQAGLQKYRPTNGRLTVESIGGIDLIDDTYNANPTSMKAAINVLAQYENSILIVGDMAELGDSAERGHRDVGVHAQQNGIGFLYACGDFANITTSCFKREKRAYLHQDELIEKLSLDAFLKQRLLSMAILVKGSRSAKMEKVVERLRFLLTQNESSNFDGEQSKC